jgi:hypothetical protein
VIDPVFSDEIQVHGIKHSGKARRGDGNDLTANPKKLAAIGKELESLGKIINEMAPVSEIPMPSRTVSRKEKNKLASRACRLKKKAQHEANKLKLHGLEEEHSDLLKSISQVKELLISKMSRNCEASQNDLTNEAERQLKKSQKKSRIRPHHRVCQQDDCEAQLEASDKIMVPFDWSMLSQSDQSNGTIFSLFIMFCMNPSAVIVLSFLSVK